MSRGTEQAGAAAAIVEAAAALLAARPGASVAEIATAAGLSRATVYRHFPARQVLLRAVADSARDAAAQGLAEANLENVPVSEGIARTARALVAVGRRYPSALRDPAVIGTRNPAIREPLAAVVRRGQADGPLDPDVPLECQLESLLALVAACLRTGGHLGQGTEDISATILRLFLDGARRRT